MTPLLTHVVCMAGLTWLTLLAASLIRARAWTPSGLLLAFGNRESMPEATPLAGRAQRTASNTLENFILFAVLALVAQVSGAASPRVIAGAQLFVWARLVYIPVYWIGIAYLRTVVWAVSIAALGVMLSGMV